jgi:hypothetical protein
MYLKIANPPAPLPEAAARALLDDAFAALGPEEKRRLVAPRPDAPDTPDVASTPAAA